MSWPDSELEHWSVFFAITPKDKPIITKRTAEQTSVTESKAKFKQLFG